MNTHRSFMAFLAFLGFAFAPAVATLAAELTATRTELGVEVKIDGKLFTEYVTNSNTKPILWPIIGPTGKPVTRPWPMEPKVPSKGTHDHPHHRSLWFTHGSVNGIDFWGEEPKGKTGRTVHREFKEIKSGPVAEVVALNDWISPEGKKVCEDERTLRFGTAGDSRWIDFDITIRASEGPVKFGDTKEGSFGLRVADSMRVDAKKGGRIINSRGQADAAAWGQRAEWVDYHGPLDDKTVGIAIMNHPTSFRYPTGWHVRTYGLFAANPFAKKGFGKSDPATLSGDLGVSYTLPQAEAITLRYRILLHRGDEKEGRVAETFAEYENVK